MKNAIVSKMVTKIVKKMEGMSRIIIIFFVLIGMNMDSQAQKKTNSPDPCQELRDSIGRLSSSMLNLTMREIKTDEKLKNIKAVNDSLSQTNKTLEASLKKANNNKYKEENETLKKQIEAQRTELERLKDIEQKNIVCDSLYREYTQENKTLKKKVETQQKELETLKDTERKLTICNSKSAKSTQENNKLKKDLQTQKDNNEKLLASKETLLKEKEAIQKRSDKIQKRLGEIANEYANLTSIKKELETKNERLYTENQTKTETISRQKADLALLQKAENENRKLANIFFPELAGEAKKIIQQNIDPTIDLNQIQNNIQQLEQAKSLDSKLKPQQIDLVSLNLQLNHFFELSKAIKRGYQLLNINYNSAKVNTQIKRLQNVQSYAKTAQHKTQHRQILLLLQGFCEANNNASGAIETAEIFRTDKENADYELNEGLKIVDDRYLFIEQELKKKKANIAYKSSIKKATCSQ